MKMLTFGRRNVREILRDPLSLIFGIGFPLVLILLLSAIQANIPVALFEIQTLTPGITVFGLSFVTLFSAQLVAKDRETSFLQRLFTTPMTAADFIAGYTLPILPIALLQAAVCYGAAFCLGLPVTWSVGASLGMILPVSVIFIAMGLLFGSLLGVKQVGGLCGALLTNLTAWLSGVWFDLNLVGGFLKTLAQLLPFWHAVELEKAVLCGNTSGMASHLFVVLGYAAVLYAAAVTAFLLRMRR